MSSMVNLPDELAERLATEAGRRGVSVEDLSAELLAAGLSARKDEDSLGAFIGSGNSGDRSWAGRDARELRAEAAARRTGS